MARMSRTFSQKGEIKEKKNNNNKKLMLVG